MTEQSFRPRLLDLFCGAGGAAMGYHLAGFDVVGVDVRPQPGYPFTFVQADALTFDLDGFDAVHASPPCQAYTRAGHLRAAQGRPNRAPDLLAPILARLAALSVPWVVENVEGAPFPPELYVVTLCGSSFGLGVRRHRLFASNVWVGALPCDHAAQGRPVGVYYHAGEVVPHGGRTARTVVEGRAAMGVDWAMPWASLKEAIPPAYTEHVGRQLLAAL